MQRALAGAQQQLPPLQQALEVEQRHVRRGGGGCKVSLHAVRSRLGIVSFFFELQTLVRLLASLKVCACAPHSTSSPALQPITLLLTRHRPQILKYSGEKMSLTKVFTTKKHQEAKLGEAHMPLLGLRGSPLSKPASLGGTGGGCASCRRLF